MTKITAIIPTLNEASCISKSLQSVSFADEVIVIDSFSTDDTVDIATSLGAKVIQRKFDNFSAQKNFAIQQASYDWIFFLDADELIDKELQKEIIEKINTPEDFVAFYIYRNFYFKNKCLRYSGWRHDKVIRLFNRQFCRYEGFVHEEIVSEKPVGFLKNKIDHYSFSSANQYKKKLDLYASLQAKELIGNKKKATWFHRLLKPSIRFFIQFVIKRGFLDGYEGYQISKLHAYGVRQRYKRYVEFKQNYRTEKIENLSIGSKTYKNDISIIIVNYKSWLHLEKCLEPLNYDNSQGKISIETIVIDNKSNDRKLIEFKHRYRNIRFVENSGNNGFANGCNLGANLASSEYLLFLNPDCIINNQTIENLWDYSRLHRNIGIASCLQENKNEELEKTVRYFPKLITLFGVFRWFYKVTIPKYLKETNEYYSTDWVSGSLLFISREQFDFVGGWNEDYWMYFEDVDLCKKIKEIGKEIVVLKTSKIFHNHGGASRINMKTSSLTKSEVLISKHVYIQNHFNGLEKLIAHVLLIIGNFINGIIFSLVGLVFFFIPKVRLQFYVFRKLLSYYLNSIKNKTWKSKRSINYQV